jgi:hypothetical protein
MNSKSMCRAWMFGPVLSLSVALASCSGPVPMGTNTPGNGSGGSGGSGGSSINLDPGATSTNTGVSTGTDVTDKENCGVTTNDASAQPVDLLLILDRSGSMTWAMDKDNSTCQPTSRNCQQRWATMKTALAQVLTTSATTVKWGLKLYSTPKQQDICGVSDGVEVPIAAGNAKQMNDAINSAQNAPDSGRTPTREAVRKGVAYLQTVTGPEPKSILLATDGQPNCVEGSADNTTSDETATREAIQVARDTGFKVYILGIGPDTMANALTSYAQAGGTDKYYAAASAEELAKQFSSIVGSVASCTFTLKTAPPVKDNVAVEFDGNKSLRAPRDTTHANGWDYATPGNYTTIQLYGEWCDKLTNGTYKSAKVLFGCPGQIIP